MRQEVRPVVPLSAISRQATGRATDEPTEQTSQNRRAIATPVLLVLLTSSHQAVSIPPFSFVHPHNRHQHQSHYSDPRKDRGPDERVATRGMARGDQVDAADEQGNREHRRKPQSAENQRQPQHERKAVADDFVKSTSINTHSMLTLSRPYHSDRITRASPSFTLAYLTKIVAPGFGSLVAASERTLPSPPIATPESSSAQATKMSALPFTV